jgi:TrmH family RNA methyltransferase
MSDRAFEDITSAANPLIKLVRALERRKAREKERLFVVEGLGYALRAQAKGFIPHILLIDRDRTTNEDLTETIHWAIGQGARIAAIPPALMARLSTLNNPQRLLLVCRQRWTPGDATRLTDQVILALERVRDPGNLGTIMRTAEAAAVTRLCLVGDACDPYSPEAARASAGSIFAMQISALSEAELVEIAKTWPGDVVGTHLSAAADFRQTYRRPVLVLMGSESRGLSHQLISACSKLVRIPMAEGVESLNVATATALMLYQLQLPLLPVSGPCRNS